MNQESKTVETPRVYNRAELVAFIGEINKQVVDKSPAYLHSILALNHVLRQPNLSQLLDKDIKQQLQDIWAKLKTTGLELQDPPVLFGVPEGTIIYADGK